MVEIGAFDDCMGQEIVEAPDEDPVVFCWDRFGESFVCEELSRWHEGEG